MYDHLSTKKLYTMPVAGTIVRNNGYGSRLMRVVEVVKDSCLLETYGLLDYGNIKFPKSPRRIIGRIYEYHHIDGKAGFGISTYDGYHGGHYTPVEVVSRMKAHKTGYQHSHRCQDRNERIWEQQCEAANQ